MNHMPVLNKVLVIYPHWQFSTPPISQINKHHWVEEVWGKEVILAGVQDECLCQWC